MRFQKVKLPNGNIIVDTGLPQRGLKPAGLELHTHMIKRLFEAAEDDEKMRNGVVRRLARMLVNTILDMAKRDEALREIVRHIDEELPEAAAMSFGERAEAEGEIWLDIGVREMTEYLDQAFGISHRLAIGTFGTAADDDEGVHLEEAEPEEDTEMHEEWKETIDE